MTENTLEEIEAGTLEIKDQLEWYNAYHGIDNDQSIVTNLDKILTLAKRGLATMPRPISEFDEFNPPNSWYITWENGAPNPTVFTEECEHKFFGTDITAYPTHFALQPALEKP